MGFQILLKFVFMLMLQSHQTSQSDNESMIQIIPKSYSLNIQPFPDEEAFAGDVVINVEFLEATNVITLDAHRNLTIKNTEVVLSKPNSDGLKKATVKIEKTDKSDETNTFSIILEKDINAGAECELKIKFSGLLNTHKTEGLFKKSYVDVTTEEPRWIIGSNFKPSFASTVFPCFDDQSFKVPFDVSIQRPSKLNSLSTMPLLQSVDMAGGWVKDVFASTPPMATFSLAIFVSDLTSLVYNKPDVQIRIWQAPELSTTAKENVSEIIFNSLKMFEGYFGVKYPLPKLDYVALPNSLNPAINNWGLIISSHNNLLLDRSAVEEIISFEIPFQWIGSLITPTSWEEDNSVSALSLFSGGFNYIKNFGKDTENWPLRPLYAMYYQLGRPNPTSAEEIRRNTLVSMTQMIYRMLTYTFTEQTFSLALKDFIKNKQFKSFHMDDFWDALTKQAHKDKNLPADMTVREVVMPWMNNYRLPFITATRNYNASSALITQGLFIRSRPRCIVRDEDILWNIPIVLTTQNKLNFANTKPIIWLKNEEFNVKNTADKNEFIIINPEEIAPYMVNYDNTNWNMLADFLQSGKQQRSKIPVLTRAKLIHDALNLAYAGILDFGTALNMTLFLKDETDLIVWKPFFIMFDHIGRHIDGSKAHTKYQTYVGILVKQLYDRLMAEGKNTNQEINEVKHVLRRVGNDQMLKESNAAYAKWMLDPSKEYKLVSNHLCAIFRYGTKEQWEFGLETLQNLKDKPEIERGYLFRNLAGCVSDHWKIKKFLNMIIFEQNDTFTDSDISYALNMLTGSADGYMTTFEYLSDNWKVLKDRLQNTPDIWIKLIYTATSLYKTQDGLNQIFDFYSKHRGEFGDAETTIHDSLRNIKEEVKWTNDNMGTLEDWLDDFILKNSAQN